MNSDALHLTSTSSWPGWQGLRKASALRLDAGEDNRLSVAQCLAGLSAALEGKNTVVDDGVRIRDFGAFQVESGLRWPVATAVIQHVTPIPLDRVLLVPDPSGDVCLSPADDVATEQRWQNLNMERETRGLAPMHDGPLFRPLRPGGWNSGRIEIRCGRSSYRLNRAFPFGGIEPWSSHLGAGLSVVVQCSDDRILLGKRSLSVGEAPGLLHVCGGHAHPPPDFRTPVTLVSACLEELDEEMHVRDNELDSLSYLGLAYHRVTGKPEFIAEARARLESGAYLSRRRDAPCHEFSTLSAVPPWSVERLAAQYTDLTPPAFAALLMWHLARGWLLEPAGPDPWVLFGVTERH